MSCSSPIRWLETSTARPSRGQRAQEAAHPDDALGVEAVEGLVEHEHRRVAEQGGRQAEPLAHAERVAAGLAPGHAVCRPACSITSSTRRAEQALGVGQPQQVVAPAAARVESAGVEQRADVAQRAGAGCGTAALDQGAALVDRVEAEDHPHGRGLAGAVGADEAGDLPGRDREGQAVEGHRLTEAFVQVR